MCRCSSSRMTFWCSGMGNSFCDGLRLGIRAVPTKPNRWSPLCVGRRWSGCNQRYSPMIWTDCREDIKWEKSPSSRVLLDSQVFSYWVLVSSDSIAYGCREISFETDCRRSALACVDIDQLEEESDSVLLRAERQRRFAVEIGREASSNFRRTAPYCPRTNPWGHGRARSVNTMINQSTSLSVTYSFLENNSERGREREDLRGRSSRSGSLFAALIRSMDKLVVGLDGGNNSKPNASAKTFLSSSCR